MNFPQFLFVPDSHLVEANILTPKGSLQVLSFLISLVSSGLCGSWATYELRRDLFLFL